MSFTSVYHRHNDGDFDTYEKRILHDTTTYHRIPSLTGGFTPTLMTSLIDQISLKYENSKDRLDSSSWKYQYTKDIAITFVQFSGRTMRRFKQRQKKKLSEHMWTIPQTLVVLIRL